MIERRKERYVFFSFFRIFLKEKSILHRYTVGDLALCKIYVSVLLECFERISVNFMDNKSLQSCFFFLINICCVYV